MMSTVLRSARSRPSWVALALIGISFMGIVMVMTSTTAPTMAQVYPCNPGTIFGVGPNGIYEVRPYVPSSRLIKGLTGGKAAATLRTALSTSSQRELNHARPGHCPEIAPLPRQGALS